MASEGVEELAHGHSRVATGAIAALTPLALAAAAYFNWKPGFWTTALGAVTAFAVSGACALWAILLRRNVMILKASGLRRTARDRQPYAALRARLETGGTPAIVYERWLTEALARVDRFFGDGDPDAASRTLWPRAFGLSTPAPLWTAASFDRCLFLALVYPLAVILALWVFTGHKGPAEAALRLNGNAPSLGRAIVLFSILGQTILLRFSNKNFGWRSVLAFVGAIVVALVGAVAVGGAGAGAVAVIFFFAVAVAFSGAVTGAVAVAVALAVSSVAAGVVAVVPTGAPTDAVAVAAVVVFTLASLNRLAMACHLRGQFLVSFVLCGLFVSLSVPRLLASRLRWESAGPLLLFLGLLTLVNAPFDWLSLGLTRALLRRGLERKAWWPYAYAILDAVLAVGVIAALAIAMLLSVQMFDDMAVAGGGKATLDLPALLKTLDDVTQPENYWVYFTLFSTMIPSLLNLCIGGTALLRGAPFATRWLLGRMPATGAVPRPDIEIIALVLTAQPFLGVGLAIVAQGALFFGLIGYVLPWIGFDLLDVCRALVDLDLPGHLVRILVPKLYR